MNFLKIAMVCIVMLLTGCDRNNQLKEAERQVESLRTKNAQLAQQNADLEESMSTYELQRKLEEREALVAAVCDDWIPTCPASVVEPGRTLLKDGIRPGDTDIASIFVLKRAVMIGVALFAMFVIYLGWHRWFAETLPKIWRAEDLVKKAKSEVDRAEKKVANFQIEFERKEQEAQAELQTIEDEIESALLELEKIQDQCMTAEKARDIALYEVRKAEAIKKALDVF